MAREVIAEIDIDDQGVVRAVERTTDGMDRMQSGGQRAARKITSEWDKTSRQFQNSGQLMIRQMFNIRIAIRALLGAFTLAGIVLAIVGLTKELITGTEWWKNFSGAATDAWKALVAGETPLQRTVRHLQDLAKETGVIVGLQQLAKVPDLLAQRRGLLAEARLIPRDPATGRSTDILRELALKRGIDDINRALFRTQELTGFTVAQFDLLTGADLSRVIFDAQRLSDGLEGTATVAREFVGAALRLPDSMNEAWEASQPLKETWEVMWELGRGSGIAFGSVADELARISETDITGLSVQFLSLNQMMEQLGDGLTEAQRNFDLITGAALTFASSFGAAIEGSGGTFKSFMADMLRGIGHLLLAWGALAAVTAYFGYGPGFQAAGIALAAGTAALLVARQLAPSGSGISDGAGSGSRGAAAATGGGRLQQTINLSIFGDPSDAQLRSITEGVAKALRDGVEGGSLVLA